MRDISGEKYKLAGIDVYQKGTLVDVFAKFCAVDETIESIRAADAKPKKPKVYKEGTAAAILNGLTPIAREHMLPTLSVQQIVDAIAGKRDIAPRERHHLRLTDDAGVIADLGPEKLAQVLVEMGETRKAVLEEGFSTFVSATAKPAAPKA